MDTNDAVPQELGEEAFAFGINILASTRRYAAEPEFASFLMLLRGQVGDLAVRDNRTLCAEILRIFRTYFEAGDGQGTRHVLTLASHSYRISSKVDAGDKGKVLQSLARGSFQLKSGTTRDFYMEAAKAKANDAVVLLDAAKPVQDVLDILEAGNVDIYKVNAMEICNLMGYGCKEGEASEEQIREVAAKALLRFSAVKHLAITESWLTD
eukprot:g20761.t1